MKKKIAKTAARKLALRSESIAVLAAPQLTGVAGGVAPRSEESELGGCTTHSSFTVNPGI